VHYLYGVPPDFYLILAAVAVAFLGRAWFRTRFRLDEQRRRRTIGSVPLSRIGATAPGKRVRIVGHVARVVEVARVHGFIVADGSGDAFVYAGSAALLQRERLPVAGDAVTIVGVARPVDRRFDRDVGAATIVFAGGEAEPLYIV
jgi:hypothetical protein